MKTDMEKMIGILCEINANLKGIGLVLQKINENIQEVDKTVEFEGEETRERLIGERLLLTRWAEDFFKRNPS